MPPTQGRQNFEQTPTNGHHLYLFRILSLSFFHSSNQRNAFIQTTYSLIAAKVPIAQAIKMVYTWQFIKMVDGQNWRQFLGI